MHRELKLDWTSILLYFALLFIGLISLFSISYKGGGFLESLLGNTSFSKQLIWIGLSVFLSLIVLLVDVKIIMDLSYFVYFGMLGVLVLTVFFAPEVKGAKAWIKIGGFQFQPGEFAKLPVALALAKFLSDPDVRLRNFSDQIKAFLIFLVPAAIIILQKDTGTALVFFALILALYREGLSPWYLIVPLVFGILGILTLAFGQIYVLIGLGSLALFLMLFKRKLFLPALLLVSLLSAYVFSVDFLVNNVLQPHQRKRIMVLFNPKVDPLGAGWNITQAKIAIGSGGLTGKGFLQGTQTRYEFVPEQETDFIFGTIGEEHGWIGSSVFIIIFVLFMLRVIYIAENSKSDFGRIFGYSFFSILFFHFAINIGMNVGYFPVIGIPLPFISYGGSHLLTLTLMFAILQNIYAHRTKNL